MTDKTIEKPPFCEKSQTLYGNPVSDRTNNLRHFNFYAEYNSDSHSHLSHTECLAQHMQLASRKFTSHTATPELQLHENNKEKEDPNAREEKRCGYERGEAVRCVTMKKNPFP